MQDNPNASEVSIFQKFVNRALAIQGQLDDVHKGDRYLRDRFNEAINIPEIKGFLKDSPVRSSQPMINRVVTQLSDQTKTAGSAFTTALQQPYPDETEGEDKYSLGQGTEEGRQIHFDPS